MIMERNACLPAGRLIPVFCAHEDLPGAPVAYQLSRTAATRGETVLMLDVMDGALVGKAGIVANRTLGDVLYRNADIRDAKYVSYNEHFTAASAGDADLEEILGSLAMFSLGYDWVFIGTAAGCTPAHVKLAGAADTALLLYGADGSRFMRAYRMLDVIRARLPKFDPLLLISGAENQGFESYDLLTGTVNEGLGSAPALAGLIEQAEEISTLAPTLLETLRQETVSHRIRAVN